MHGTKNGRLAGIARSALAAGLLLAVLIRLTVRDGYPWISVVYYSTPLGVVLGGTVLGLFASWRCGRKREALAWLSGCLPLLVWWLAADWQWHRPVMPPSQRDIRVLFWNVARWKDLSLRARYIRQLAPDVVALVEAGEADEAKRQMWQTHCPGYDVALLGGGIQVLVKNGSSGQAEGGNFGHGCIYRTIPVQTNGTALRLCIVDLDSDPTASRRRPLQLLADLAAASAGEKLVIVGDFNCPADSVHFAPLREHRRLAFEEAGFGYSATWPVPMPVHELDQIWLGDEFDVVACEHIWTAYSDHRPVLATIRLR